ncbi:hypothetical protein lbkm_4170 [Lachnospiraceae bacterium KM106-2]|nr:hypothetical protein lbkm_4170 [Lachnospiraceae bacterium KM106-2]
MNSIKQIFTVVAYNFRGWHKNLRIIITFLLTFILCFLLCDKVLVFADKTGTILQIFEPFIWTFGDSNSVLLISVLLMLLFVDMPFISTATPFYLMRTTRKIWLIGQGVYIVIATLIDLLFILLSTAVLCMGNSFIGNQWSDAAATLGYSGLGKKIAVPALVKTLEMSTPYEATLAIFLLILLYTLFMVFIMLLFNIMKGPLWGNISVIVFSLYGFLLKPTFFINVLKLPQALIYKANVLVGWISPLNHATYHMHNFGYDELPTLKDTYVFFTIGILVCFFLTLLRMKKYNFNFTGTEE